MTKYISKLVALALFAVALTGAAPAQNSSHAVRANIPFSFYAGGKLLPAGEYIISASMDGGVITLDQHATGKASLLLGDRDDGSRDGRTVLTFKLVGGEAYALRELQTPDFGLRFNAKAPPQAMSVKNQMPETVAVVAEAR